MTQKEFFEAVMNADVEQELRDFAADRLEKLIAQREKANERAKAKRAENSDYEAIRAALSEVMTTEPKTAPTLIAEAGLDITPHKVAYAMRTLVEDGTVVKSKIAVNGKGKHVAYAVAAV